MKFTVGQQKGQETSSLGNLRYRGRRNIKQTGYCDKLFVGITFFFIRALQREHFKLDWHRFNLKQKLMDKPILSEDAFEETISGISCFKSHQHHKTAVRVLFN